MKKQTSIETKAKTFWVAFRYADRRVRDKWSQSSFNNGDKGWGTEEWAREAIAEAERRTRGIFHYRVQTKQPSEV